MKQDTYNDVTVCGIAGNSVSPALLQFTLLITFKLSLKHLHSFLPIGHLYP